MIAQMIKDVKMIFAGAFPRAASLIILVLLVAVEPGGAIFASEAVPGTGGKEALLPLTPRSAPVAIMSPSQESPEVRYFIDAPITIDNCHVLSGWLVVENQDTRGQNVYLQLERPDGTIVHFSTTPNERPDVGAYFKNKLYDASGFRAVIPLQDGAEIGDCTIRLVVKNKSGIFSSPVWHYGLSAQVGITPPGLESRSVDFYFAVQKKPSQGRRVEYHLSGWVYVKNQETRGQEVYIQLGKPGGKTLHFAARSLARKDVGKGFNNPFYDHSGFSARIPLRAGLDIDAYAIRLVVKNRNGMHKSPVWKDELRRGSFAGEMSFFVAVNWLLAMITLIILFLAIWRDRSLLVKPSIMAILFFHVMCQWGSAFQAGRIESALPQPWLFVLLSHGFPLLGLIGSLFTGRPDARQIWGRITTGHAHDPLRKGWAWVIFAGCFTIFFIVYLNHVPFHSTGLYKIFSSPLEASLARDQSVKLLANPFMRYGFSIVMAVFAPLLVVLTTQGLLWMIRRRKWFAALLCAVCLGGIFVAASISGARAYSAFLILAVVFALLLRRGFPINPLYLGVGVLLVLVFPTALTLLREGKTVNAKNFIEYFRVSTYERVMIIPMETGLQHVHYAQTHGVFGIQAIPKLAAVMGIEPMNVPNFIAKIYGGNPLVATTANTAYVYAYYSYFGWIAFIPCLLGLWLLDLSLLVYRRCSDNLLLPCVACVSLATNTFSQTEYTISLFSQGFLLLLLVSWAVDRVVIKIDSAIREK